MHRQECLCYQTIFDYSWNAIGREGRAHVEHWLNSTARSFSGFIAAVGLRWMSRLNRPRKKSLVYALRFSDCCFFVLIGLFSRCFGLPSAVLALSADTTAPALHRGNQFH